MRRLLRDLGFCKNLILFIVLLLPSAVQSQPRAESGIPKYVFFFLSDGGGMAHLEIARQYNRQVHNEGFVIVDKIIKEGNVGVMTTHAADAFSTDSAAAATALAGGCKANVGSPMRRFMTPARPHSFVTCPTGATTPRSLSATST